MSRDAHFLLKIDIPPVLGHLFLIYHVTKITNKVFFLKITLILHENSDNKNQTLYKPFINQQTAEYKKLICFMFTRDERHDIYLL